jgi:hypothetical protein
VPRLIDAKFAAARQRHLREQTPALVLHRTTGDAVLAHFGNERLNVIAQEVELLPQVIFTGWMDGRLCRWQPENEISATAINGSQSKYIV